MLVLHVGKVWGLRSGTGSALATCARRWRRDAMRIRGVKQGHLAPLMFHEHVSIIKVGIKL